MDKSLEIFCSILSRETGLTFPTSRYSFVMNRLEPLLKRYECLNPTELILKSKKDFKLKIEIVNSLTTNETWFFRHPEHFDILRKKIIPELINTKNDKSLNIWSAGCSIGAELYSILITILESLPTSKNFNINILGSDISLEAIQLAKKGIYDARDLRTTDRAIITKYFDQINDNSYKIKDELQHYVKFEYLNLLETWPPRNFDIIFCRNTMIYFNEENKQKLIKRFFKALNFSGYFFTSANEQVNLNEEEFGIKKLYLENEYVYQKKNLTSNTCELYFKNPSELLRATNCLRKNSFSFQYGPAVPSITGNKIRYIIIKANDCEKILNFFRFNSIEIEKSILVKH